MNTLKILLPVFGLSLSLCVHAQVSALEKAEKQFEFNNFEGATKSYLQALETVSDKNAVFARLGDVCIKTGRINEAIDWYDKASAAGDASVLLSLGKSYILVGKYVQAADVLKKIAESNSEARHFLESCNFALEVKPASMYEVSNAEGLNSASDDYFPSFTCNQTVAFLSCRTNMPRRLSKMPTGANQLLHSIYSNGAFTKPEHFNSDLKNVFGEGPFTQSGSLAVITQNNFVAGIRPMELQGLELSMKKGNINSSGRWKTTQSFSLGGAGYSNGFATVSADGSQLVFASNRPGGQGGFDLYLCKREGEQWGAPENLAGINSPGNEITPHFSGKKLFFSSDYLKGLGGYDIFETEQSNGVYNEVSHLGDQVNSSADDYGFIFDENRGYGLFSSNRDGGKGGEDLYLARSIATDLHITVVDEDSRPVSDVKIDLSNCGSSLGYTDKNGKFSFQLAGEAVCEVNFNRTGFIPSVVTLRGNRGSASLFPVVKLKKGPMPYSGFVLDEDGLPVEGVLVKATNTTSQLKLEAMSDANGKYNLPLEASNDYLIYFSKPKFINLSINKKRLSKDDLSLGSVKLRMSFEDDIKSEKKSGKGSKEQDQPRFTLQIASVSDQNADLNPFKVALKEIGEVYMTPGTNGTFKIKVGKFVTREEAVQAYEKAQKAGFKPMISTAITGIPQTERQPPVELLRPDTGVYSNYALKLCALSKPENFNSANIEHLGKVSSMKTGEMTIFLLNNFRDLEAAKSALSEVQKNGFPDAFVVEKKDGQLIKVKW